MPSSQLDLDCGVEAAPCFPVVVGHRADALELPWPSPEATDALSLLTEPIILRGGARSFLSSGEKEEEEGEEAWSLEALARRDPARRVLVRAAPTPSFPVPNGALLPFVVAAFGARAAPSLASLLPLREAAERMQAGCQLPPLAYFSSSSSSSSPSSSSSSSSSDVVSDGTEGGRREWYYIQSEVPREWLRDRGRDGGAGSADSSPLSAPFLLPGGGGGGGGEKENKSKGRISQDFRLWLSPPNAVSPLHWDTSRSALAVLRGAKTFHFWTPEETLSSALGPRSDWGLLRRRCAADPSQKRQGGGGSDFWPLRRRERRSYGSCPPAALRAVVRAGDAVAFPPFWAHHVLSHNEEEAEEEAAAAEAGGGGGAAGREEERGRAAAPTGRPIVALTRRASGGASQPPPTPPRRVVVPSRLWKGLGGAVRWPL